MIVCIILLVIGLGALIYFLVEKIKKYSIKETIIKAIVSLLFIALAVYSFIKNNNHTFGIFVITGLIFGLIGDITLELKYVDLNKNKMYTYIGFISFGIGHILYITGIFLNFANIVPWFIYVLPFVLGLIGGILVVVLEKPMGLEYGEYKLICFIYGIILFSMTATTVSFAITYKLTNATLNMLAIAGTLFAVSDLILSGTYFGKNRDKPFDLISNALTYYVAQYLIAFSIFFI